MASRRHGVEAMVHAAAALPRRTIEPRLSGGWAHAPLDATRSGAGARSAADYRLTGAAAEVLANDSDPGVVGVARLVVGNTRAAIVSLGQATAGSTDSSRWNDLGAALLIDAKEKDDGDVAVDALTTIEKSLALRISPEARFNRALALQRIGLLDQARGAWRTAAAADESRAWAGEALERAERLTAVGSIDRRAVYAQLQRAGEREDVEELRRITRSSPQLARTWGEGIGLAGWADAVRSGDVQAAARQLEAADVIGSALRDVSREALLSDAVATIRRAKNPAALAEAHVVYREGRIAHSRHDPVAAETLLRRATSMFEAAQSPMSLVSRYYAGSALHAQGRIVEATTALDGLAALDPEGRGYRALAAEIGWERGGCRLNTGDESEALRIFTESRRIAADLREHELAASFDLLIADTLDVLGQSAEAWKARRQALETLTSIGADGRVAVALSAAARIRMRREEWERASTLLDLASVTAARANDALLMTSVLVQQTEAHARGGDLATARRDRDAGNRWLKSIDDETVRRRIAVDQQFASGLIDARERPADAVRVFNDVADYFEKSGEAVHLPPVYLERGRAERRLGDAGAAARDFEAGIATFDRQRSAVRDPEQRAAMFAAADALLDEAVSLAADRGDEETAFAYAERGRARTLLERFADNAMAPKPPPLDRIRGALAEDAAIAEYVVLPDRVIAFVVRPSGLTMIPLHTNSSRLRGACDELAAAMAARDDQRIAAAGSVLDDLLVRPLRSSLTGVSVLAIAGDRFLASVPFQAVYSRTRRRFLIEDFALINTQSATLAIAASRHAAPAGGSILAVAATDFDRHRFPGASTLANADFEAETVASLVKGSRLLRGREATVAAFLDAADAAEIIHFAGHAVAREGSVPDSRLLLAPSDEDHGELRARTIAAHPLARVRVAVLSACRAGESGDGRDDARGIAAALLAAGVPSVVASASDVEDEEASRLATAFERQLLESGRPATALARTLRNAIQARVSVSSWGRFTLFGGSTELVRSGR